MNTVAKLLIYQLVGEQIWASIYEQVNLRHPVQPHLYMSGHKNQRYNLEHQCYDYVIYLTPHPLCNSSVRSHLAELACSDRSCKLWLHNHQQSSDRLFDYADPAFDPDAVALEMVTWVLG